LFKGLKVENMNGLGQIFRKKWSSQRLLQKANQSGYLTNTLKKKEINEPMQTAKNRQKQ